MWLPFTLPQWETFILPLTLIRELKTQHPEFIFLSEGLTRPNNMIHLARIGFTMSYDYFPWRNTKHDLVSYYSSLTEAETRECFRPILGANTPQYLSPVLQGGGLQASMARLILAATLCGNYGIYGPPYEFCEIEANAPGSTEYIDSEQYEVRFWDWSRTTRITALLPILNVIRRGNAALQSSDSLWFHAVDNDQIIAFSKTTKDYTNRILTVVNLDPHNMQSGRVTLSLDRLRLSTDRGYTASDLLTGERYSWFGARNFVALDTVGYPAHILRLG